MVTSVSITCQALALVLALWLLGCVLAVLIQCLLTLTLVPPQCKEGGFPQELWLGVSADAVSVYKRGEGKPLEVFQYEHILSFGAPLANTYKIVVDERELLFETSEVRDRGGARQDSLGLRGRGEWCPHLLALNNWLQVWSTVWLVLPLQKPKSDGSRFALSLLLSTGNHLV